ncbi:hypothetical protein SLA2020_024470 [Shorea laevis]
MRSLSHVSARGVIRDHEGTWAMCFAKNLAYGTNNDAELWGVKTGLELAFNLEIKKLEVKFETNSTFVVNALDDSSFKYTVHKTLIASGRLLM